MKPNIKLKDLLDKLPSAKITGISDNKNIAGIVYDPLRVEQDFLYVAINIYTQLDGIEIVDGHPYIDDAIANGAVVVVLEKDRELPSHITKILVPDSRKALSILANLFYGNPSKQMQLIGVTGTNGKTTTTHIIESILEQHHAIGLIGTIYCKIAGKIHKSKDTTPEPPDLQAIFQKMNDNNCDYCTLEASSHGIDFHRLNSLDFAVAVFTNLTPDHMEYHKTMENYLNVKLRLFKGLSEDSAAVINIDDPYGDTFFKATSAKKLTTGIDKPADIMAKNIQYRLDGTDYDLVTPEETLSINSLMIGKFNVYNTLSAVGTALSLDFSMAEIKTGIERNIHIAGRFEMVECGQDFAVVIDYAHSVDGLESVLRLAKTLNPSRIMTLFGCGGERSPEKRPLMGQTAVRYSDKVIVTSDNPRNEDPNEIINAICSDIPAESIEIIIDRRKAIQQGIAQCKKGDLLLILGKGHESIQIINDETLPFSDKEEAEKALRMR